MATESSSHLSDKEIVKDNHLPPSKKPKNMTGRNKKSWTQCISKGEKWIQKTSPAVPSFAFLYWRADKQNLEWFGPKHMSDFVHDPQVEEKFKSTSLKSSPLKRFMRDSSSQEKSSTTNISPPLQIFSLSASDYTADVLYLILPKVLNPLGIRSGHYTESNRPSWFPKNLPFVSPTHKKSATQGKFVVQELQQIFQAFLDNCPDSFALDPANSPFTKYSRKRSVPKRLLRSATASTSRLEQQKKSDIKNLHRNVENGIKVCFISPQKGYGVITTKRFRKGDFVCEYPGELISGKEGVKRERKLQNDSNHDNSKCYMYFFISNGKRFCIDATAATYTARKGRYINHSRKKPNIITKKILLDGQPRLYFVARCTIPRGKEILYDYNDKQSLKDNPWLRK